MSNNSMQRIADLEAQVAQLTAQRDGLQRQINSQPNYTEILGGIAAHISREMQITREDFTGKFAGHMLPAVTNFKNDVEKTQQQQEQIEQRQNAFELRLQKHRAEIEDMLKESNTKQTGTMKKFVEALKGQNDRLDSLLDEQQETVKSFNQAAAATVQSASMCASFASDYQKTSTEAGMALQRVSTQAREEMNSYLGDLKRDFRDALQPVVKRVRDLTEAQMKRRLYFTMYGFFLGIALAAIVAWGTQPSAYTQLQAKWWRNWQGNFTEDQANRVNKLLAEFEKEDAEREQRQNKDK